MLHVSVFSLVCTKIHNCIHIQSRPHYITLHTLHYIPIYPRAVILHHLSPFLCATLVPVRLQVSQREPTGLPQLVSEQPRLPRLAHVQVQHGVCPSSGEGYLFVYWGFRAGSEGYMSVNIRMAQKEFFIVYSQSWRYTTNSKMPTSG